MSALALTLWGHHGLKIAPPTGRKPVTQSSGAGAACVQPPAAPAPGRASLPGLGVLGVLGALGGVPTTCSSSWARTPLTERPRCSRVTLQGTNSQRCGP